MKSLEWIKADEAARLLEVKRRLGRPPRATKPSLERIEIRVTKSELRDWRRCAKNRGMTLSDWIRGWCDSGCQADFEYDA